VDYGDSISYFKLCNRVVAVSSLENPTGRKVKDKAGGEEPWLFQLCQRNLSS